MDSVLLSLLTVYRSVNRNYSTIRAECFSKILLIVLYSLFFPLNPQLSMYLADLHTRHKVKRNNDFFPAAMVARLYSSMKYCMVEQPVLCSWSNAKIKSDCVSNTS